MRKLITLISITIVFAAPARGPWSMDECMSYAAEHASAVASARWTAASASATQTEAIADFFPSVSAQTGTQFSWGRNIDPETNTYKDIATFNNGYGLYASLTIFDGGQTLNRYRQARTERTRSLNAVEMRRDDSAIEAMMAYADAVYYHHTVGLAQEKLCQSRAMLILTQRQEELGLKGRPDVAQAEATVADDDYNLVHQRNLRDQAMLKLRSVMNLPWGEALDVDTASSYAVCTPERDNADDIYAYALDHNCKAKDARLAVETSRYAYSVAKGNMLPSISLNAGISTAYYKTLGAEYHAPAFADQFRNNRGEYISASLNIPLFSRLGRVSNVKRARYALENAREQLDEQNRRLHDDIASAVMDRDGYAKEIISLQTKVDADGEALRLNTRKYEEGLMSLIDLQLSANTYYASRVTLLQKRMLYILKDKLVEYYKGNRLWM